MRSFIATLAGVVACWSASHLAARATQPPPASSQPASVPSSQPQTQPDRERVEIGGEVFDLEIAADAAARERGLMHRDHIDDHGGMIFIYAEPQVLGFWMKNCLIEMDIVYVDGRGEVTATHRMVPPRPPQAGETESRYEARLPRYSSRVPAQFAIELQAGTIERLKIKRGDRIELDVPRLTRLAEAEFVQ